MPDGPPVLLQVEVLGDAAAGGDAGVEEHQVEPAVHLLRGLGRRDDLVVVADVAAQEGRAELVGDRLPAGLVDVAEHDRVTASYELPGDLRAEAGGAAGDEGRLGAAAHAAPAATPVPCAPAVPPGATPVVSRRLRGVDDQPRDPLAVLAGVAAGVLQALGALEVEVRVVLPGVADAAVVLDHRAGHLEGDVAGLGLGDRGGEPACPQRRRRPRARRRARRARPSTVIMCRSARWCLIAWNEPTGLPNCTRVLSYSTVSLSA